MADQKLRIVIEANDKASKKIKGITKSLDSVGQAAGVAGRQLAMIGAPIAIAGGLAIKTFVDFESAFTGVRKTVDASEAEFQAISNQFRQMSQEIPVAVNELSRIGEAAGQLGIQSEDIVGFTRVMADLGVTTNLTSEEAATAMARIANVTGLPAAEFENLGSALVDLGNNMATTEGEILHFSTRIAATGDLAGLTQADILAIGAAMTAVGVQAEAGGTAVQKVLISMTKAYATGGKQLDEFAKVAGVSSDEFKRLWKDDASEAFALFIEGLKSGGDEAFTMLEELGLQDIRATRSLLALSNAGDELRNAFTRSNAAFADNNALAAEAALRYGTAASQFSIAKNSLTEMGIVVGQALVPGLLALVDAIKPVLKAVTDAAENNPKWVKTIALATVALLALAGVLLTVSVAMPIVVLAIKAWNVAMIAFKIITGQATLAQYGLNIAMSLNPIGLVVAGVIALIAAFVLLRDKLPAIFGTIGKMLDWWINNTWGRFINLVIDGLNHFGADIGRFESNMEDSFRSAGEFVEEFIDGVVDAVNPFDDAVTQMVEAVDQAEQRFADPIDGMVSHILGIPAAMETAARDTQLFLGLITSSATEASDAFAFAQTLALSNALAEFNAKLAALPSSEEIAAKEAQRLADKAAAAAQALLDAAAAANHWSVGLSEAQVEAIKAAEETFALAEEMGSLDKALKIVKDRGLDPLLLALTDGTLTIEEFIEKTKEVVQAEEDATDAAVAAADELERFNKVSKTLVEQGMNDLLDAYNAQLLSIDELEQAAQGLIDTEKAQETAALLAAAAEDEHTKAMEKAADAAEKERDALIDLQAQAERGFAARRSLDEKELLGDALRAFKGGVETSQDFLKKVPAMDKREQALLQKFGFSKENIGQAHAIAEFLKEQISGFFGKDFNTRDRDTPAVQLPQNFAGGGIVQGPIGSPQRAIVHGGEQILTPGQQSRGGVTVVIEGPVYGFEDFGDKVSQAIQEGVRRGQYAGVLVTE